MDTDQYIKRYQSKLKARIERLEKLKASALEGGFTHTNALDARIIAMRDELNRLQKIKHELRETHFQKFVQNYSTT